MFLLLKPIIFKFLNARSTKQFLVDCLTKLSERSDNQLDDVAVAYIERLLLQNSPGTTD